MKKLDWFILKSYLGPLIMTFFICRVHLIDAIPLEIHR